ncbi:hypothetical protein [Cellulomonas sp. HZM]|uniref:hypothetical protein n=1 Tax=Cellulomonas sp. HZM TaxID=1454010 RepID=UPI0005579AC9|nr:hypothetical protein [Cellulomonas sp. HZM]
MTRAPIPEAELFDALRPYLLPGEPFLAVARLRDSTSPWRLFVVMTLHRFARVALRPGTDPAVVVVDYADVRSSSWLPVEFGTGTGEHVLFGVLADPGDAERLEQAMWDLTVPVQSDASDTPSRGR